MLLIRWEQSGGVLWFSIFPNNRIDENKVTDMVDRLKMIAMYAIQNGNIQSNHIKNIEFHFSGLNNILVLGDAPLVCLQSLINYTECWVGADVVFNGT